MARLIDVEPILMRWNTESLGRKEMYDMVRNAPMVDAVPVVRCKDCKWWDYSEDEYSICCHPHYDIISVSRDGAGYCSFAERKSDE